MSTAGQVLTLVAGGWLALAAHEGGHVVTGLLVRFRFGFFALGPLRLVAEGERIRLRWNRVLSSWGGMAMMVPGERPRLAARIALFAAGGPVTSLAVAVAAFWAAVVLLPGTAAGRFSMATALMSSAVFLATAQPFGTGTGIPSDGGRVLMFLRHRAEAEALASAQTANVNGSGYPVDQSRRVLEAGAGSAKEGTHESSCSHQIRIT
jgi:hypothetical protein